MDPNRREALCDDLLLRRVGPFQNTREARDFLENDLRVETSRLSPSRLECQNQAYRGENVRCLLKAL